MGRKTFHNIPSVIAYISPDIALANTSDIFSEFFLSNSFFVSPVVDFILDISDPWDTILARMSRSKRKRIRRIQKLGYTFEVTNDIEKLRSFYYEMYVPRILKRHEKSAKVICLAECERLFRSGGLLLVKSNGEYISGAIYVPRGNELYIPTLGISKIDQHLTEGGHVTLYFLILWAKQQGFKKIDYSICKPFLTDGIFCYKKEWGMKIRPYKGQDAEIFAIRFCNFGCGVRDFLLDNPFIYMDGEHLKGLVVLDSDIKDLYKEYYVPGLKSLIILSLTHDLPIFQSQHPSMFCLKTNIEAASPLNFFIKMAAEEIHNAYYLDFTP